MLFLGKKKFWPFHVSFAGLEFSCNRGTFLFLVNCDLSSKKWTASLQICVSYQFQIFIQDQTISARTWCVFSFKSAVFRGPQACQFIIDEVLSQDAEILELAKHQHLDSSKSRYEWISISDHQRFKTSIFSQQHSRTLGIDFFPIFLSFSPCMRSRFPKVDVVTDFGMN